MVPRQSKRLNCDEQPPSCDKHLYLEKDRRTKGGNHTSTKFYIGCTVALAVLSLLSIATIVRHLRRGGELDPLLDVIAAAPNCAHLQTATCAMLLDSEAALRFDLHEAENPLLGFVDMQLFGGRREMLRETLSGAHIRVSDPKGIAYEFLTHLPRARKRISSHKSDREQYGIVEGRVMSELLVGTDKNVTWFQLEGAPWDPFNNPMLSSMHVLDFIEYAALRWNIGPQGISQFTDKNPMIVDRIVPLREACPQTCPSELQAAHGAVRSSAGAVAVAAVASFLDGGGGLNVDGASDLNGDRHNGASRLAADRKRFNQWKSYLSSSSSSNNDAQLPISSAQANRVESSAEQNSLDDNVMRSVNTGKTSQDDEVYRTQQVLRSV